MSPCRKLPDYKPLTSHADCKWHGNNRVEKCEVIDEVYEKVVHWKPNLFQVPSGAEKKGFVEELAD